MYEYAPGSVLTSIVNRVDMVVSDILDTAFEGSDFAGGTVELGIEGGYVDYWLDTGNADVMSPDIVEGLDAVKRKIVSGGILLADPASDSRCTDETPP